MVAATLFDGVQPWSVPLSSVRSAAQTGPLAARACVWHSKAWLSPAKSLRDAARGRCVLVPLRMADAAHTHDGSCGPACGQEPGAVLMAKLGALDDADERRAAVRENFQQCDDAAMEYLAARLQAGEEGNWQALLLNLQEMMQERLEAGKELLVALLASGEINVLDRKVVEKVKSGECDPSFLNVLQINMQDAQANADQEDGQRLNILMHIYTRVQEELEKKAKPAVGLLHKLLRMIDEPEIRTNVLEHNLKPKPEEERAMIVIDGKMTLDDGALVSPTDFSKAIVEYMNRIRGMDQIDEAGFTEDDIAQTFEDCRVIAKEARIQVEQFYTQKELDEFTESLTPVFDPIMGTLANYRRPQ